MRKTLIMASFSLLLILALVTFLPVRAVPERTPPSGATGALQKPSPGALEIYGDVATPLNLTYAELVSMPMVSEVAELRCVTGSPDVIYNWTGVPLFYLLTLVQIKPDAYDIVTLCSDGYSSDLLVEDALQPTTILALTANGTSLPQLTYGPAGPNRLVVPGEYGDEWASGIEELEVVTSSGYTGAADVPDYGPMPTPTPPLQTLDLFYGSRTFEVGAFTNASTMASSLDSSRKALNVNVTVPEGASCFTDFILQQDFLSRPYNVTVDGKAVSPVEADTNTSSYVYLVLTEGFHTVSIVGAEFDLGPEAIVSYPATVGVGQNVKFDASKSVDVGFIVSYEWSFGDGTNGTGPVVSHVYDKAGTYQVTLNVTNNEGFSSLKTFKITVGGPLDILLLIQVVLATMLAALILIFGFLLRKRRTTPRQAAETQS